MTVSTEFHNWSDHPHDGAARTKRGSPALMRVRDYHLARWGGQSLSSKSLYQFRPLDSGKPSAHAGCAVDLRYSNPGPGRDVVLQEMLPFYIDNSVELHIQAIHDYVGCRVWRAHRSGDANGGWKKQKKGSHDGNMGNPTSQWLHLEVNRSGWDDDRLVEQMLGGKPDRADRADKRIVDAPPFEPFDLFQDVNDPPRVRWLQTILNERGWGKIAVTGTFDEATATAVNAMQLGLGVDDDGRYGRLTALALSAFLKQHIRSEGPAPIETPADWTKVSADERMFYVMRRLIDRYTYPVNTAAGIVGNLDAESGVIPNRIQGSTSTSPMTARDFRGVTVKFTAKDVMNRRPGQSGPKDGGIGLAQWTFTSRRTGLFKHEYDGRALGPDVLFDMDAQIDYLDFELRNNFSGVRRLLLTPGATVDDASDEVTYNYETPGTMFDGKRKRKRDHDEVRKEFAKRRKLSHKALQAYERLVEG